MLCWYYSELEFGIIAILAILCWVCSNILGVIGLKLRINALLTILYCVCSAFAVVGGMVLKFGINAALANVL